MRASWIWCSACAPAHTGPYSVGGSRSWRRWESSGDKLSLLASTRRCERRDDADTVGAPRFPIVASEARSFLSLLWPRRSSLFLIPPTLVGRVSRKRPVG